MDNSLPAMKEYPFLGDGDDTAPKLPPALAERPLRVSFLPMGGCAHFCSFCADNAGKRVRMHPFGMIRRSLEDLPFRLESAALYNACDGFAYRWEERGRRYDVTHLAELFRRMGCRKIGRASCRERV